MTLLDWLQALGVVVSIIAFIYSREAKQRSLALREEITDIEKQREEDRLAEERSAQIVAELRRLQSTKYRLEITNEGEAPARSVEVLADDKPIGEFFRYQDYTRVEDHIFERLDPANKIVLRAETNRDSPLPSKVHGRFEDDAGGGRFQHYVSSRSG
jgi:hypothetical protein